MKATAQYFNEVQFIMQYKLVLAWLTSSVMTIQMKAF